ncbi:glycoside hydrolase family 3 N-terminal domain-containing protein, partial [Candidatus Neomarinimicrobiota bacterium]
PPEIHVEKEESWAEKTLSELTLRQKIAQMLIYPMNLEFLNKNHSINTELKKMISTDGIGGIHLWSGSAALSYSYLNELQKLSPIPILVEADLEKGLNQQFKSGTAMPPALAIAATGNVENAYKIGQIVGREGRAVGIHLNLAPVVDVNNNADNPIINVRSFGDDPELVGEYASNFINGLHASNMLAAAKHFPGHGDTQTDSHSYLAEIPSDSTQLWEIELRPYQTVIEADVDIIMVSHIQAPNYQPAAGMPATFSEFWIKKILRNRLGFQGAVITDAMDMASITSNFSDQFALVSAINAGCDIIIQNHDYKGAIDKIEEAVLTGLIDLSRIDEAAFRMLKLKQKVGLHLNSTVDYKSMQSTLGNSDHSKVAKKVSGEALTLVKDDKSLIPLKLQPEDLLYIIDVWGREYNHSQSILSKKIKQSLSNAISYSIDESDSHNQLESILSEIPNEATVLVNLFSLPKAWKNRIFLTETQSTFIQKLIDKVDESIMVSFGNPYLITEFPNVNSYLIAYNDAPVIQAAVHSALIGLQPIAGKLPLEIKGIAERGFGINTERSEKTFRKRVKQKPTLKRVLLSEISAEIDSLNIFLNRAVKESAFPGGVLLAGKDGKIFLHYAFGYQTYSKKLPDNIGDIFDLASLTKVITTTSAVMLLYDDGNLDIKIPIGKYLPEFINNVPDSRYDRKSVTIEHLLTHTSGLPSFRQYYKVFESYESKIDSVYRTKLINPPDTETVYSDIGMILLGKIVERVSGQSLDEFLAIRLFKPLGMNSTYFNPPNTGLRRIIPTEFEPATGSYLKGKVHDENARCLGGVAGHAGLFSTASDLAKFSQMLLNGGEYAGRQYFKSSTVELFTSTINEDANNRRGYGWDYAIGKSSGGVYLGEKSFGHTGFTGTSLWIDPDNDIFVILLTNAVHPHRTWKNPKYYDWRQRIHSAVYESLGFSKQNPWLEWRDRWKH